LDSLLLWKLMLRESFTNVLKFRVSAVLFHSAFWMLGPIFYPPVCNRGIKFMGIPSPCIICLLFCFHRQTKAMKVMKVNIF